MSHLLYKKFLKNKRVYVLNSAYWKRVLNKIFRMSSSVYVAWLNTTYCNGKKFYDGNPIFNGLFKEKNKAVRIIQEEPESEDMSISAWIDKIKLEKDMIYELVISLELSKESRAIAESLVKAWIVDDLSYSEMENFINEKLDFLYPTEENDDFVEELKAA